jgi:hypothetical protein
MAVCVLLLRFFQRRIIFVLTEPRASLLVLELIGGHTHGRVILILLSVRQAQGSTTYFILRPASSESKNTASPALNANFLIKGIGIVTERLLPNLRNRSAGVTG